MKLLTSPTSPFVRKVVVTLHELGLTGAVEMTPVKNTAVQPDPTVAAANPLGKIPALILPDGPALHDSRVICRYLDAQAGGALYPETRLWQVLTLESMADGMMDAAVLMTYERALRPEARQWDGWIDAQWTKVANALDALEARWISHLAGQLDVAQVGVACALSYLDFRHDARDWRRGRPQLAAWHATFEARESMENTRPQ